MRVLSIILLAVVLLVGLVAGLPSEIIDVDTDAFEHEQKGVAGSAVHGEYEALDAHGNEYEVKYVADHLGFRLVP
ncbi:cuticle protein CP575-like [Eriocheir sinensis]|uniref:cuticle protein CP575-like n=1 Tax=Eriocheir sinensis TaxID=95602 RepID=UPI0021C56822|nr:cuticle protein CP575-like [Eriocheir sinensis]